VISSRRRFILQTVSLVSVGAPVGGAIADTGSVSESDLTAHLLSYRMAATSVDKAEHPKYVSGQVCANCRHYKGVAADASGPCTIFFGKRVSANGWCSLYAETEH
jgi:High potential iron-sulfur protein